MNLSTPALTPNPGATTIVTTRVCFDLKVVDAQPHHPCYSWNHTLVQCEIDWPCEVRQYLVAISPLIYLTRGLLSYGTLVIIVLGIFLNLLSLYTIISSGLSKTGTGIYLISLAICDCGNLLFNYGVGIGRAHVHSINNLFMDSEWLCRWHAVFVEIFQLISAWIVVSFTAERCLAIWYPIVFRNTSRTARAKKVVTILCTVLTLFALSKLVLTGFEKDSVFGYPGCYSHRYRWHGIAYVRVAFQTWIPTVLVATFNLFMLCKLRRIRKARERLTELKRRTKLQTTRQGSFMNRPAATTPMLVAVSVAYLVLVFPLGVVQTVELLWNVENPQPIYQLGQSAARQRFIQWKNTKLLLKYVRSFCFAFYQINYCVNFFLYFAAGLQFRVHLQKKFHKWFGVICCNDGSGSRARNGADARNIPIQVTPGTISTVLETRRDSNRLRRGAPPKLSQNNNEMIPFSGGENFQSKSPKGEAAGVQQGFNLKTITNVEINNETSEERITEVVDGNITGANITEILQDHDLGSEETVNKRNIMAEVSCPSIQLTLELEENQRSKAKEEETEVQAEHLQI